MNTLYIVVPCYNEEEILNKTSDILQKKIKWLIEQKKITADSKILFVDDGVNAEPNIWFRNESGELCWVKVECGTESSDVTEPVKVASKTKACCQGIGYTGVHHRRLLHPR